YSQRPSGTKTGIQPSCSVVEITTLSEGGPSWDGVKLSALKVELKRFCETRPRKRRGMFPCERCRVNRSTAALLPPLRRSAPPRRRLHRIDPLPDGSF